MRTIKKQLKVKTVECILYDRILKEERTVTFILSEIEEVPTPPEGTTILEQKVLEEKKVTYSLSPADFVKYATIE